MRVSINWLRDFVDVDVPAAKLTELLNFSGTKVEGSHALGHGVRGVVVAEVLSIEQHPNADTLTLVDVSQGAGEQRRVVCGARNFNVGDKVPLAVVGSHLPEMDITERTIRGATSQGMLCSGAELGIFKDHSGILVLSPDAPLGEDVVRVLGLDDTVLELEITPNRGDCMGVIGVAREVAAVLGKELKIPTVEVPTSNDLDSRLRVDIADPAACRRYVGRFIEGVKVAPSPAWMVARLVAAGSRPISNVVDVTNYVLLETGHPLHAFDAGKVHDHHIVVRRARRNEKIVTLDGVERDLDPDDLVIADPRTPLALAGIIGGAASEVGEDTSDVILESAWFDQAAISYASQRHLLRTEASARFERGADIEMAPFAAARAAALVAELAGGRVAQDVVDAYPAPLERPHVRLRPRRTTAVLGYDISASTQGELLRSVGFEVGAVEGGLDVMVPSFRSLDVLREADVIEEVARLAGLERLPSTLPPGQAGALDASQLAERRLRITLAALGLHETWTSSFSGKHDLDRLRLAVDHPSRRVVRVANPMNEDEEGLRTTLLPGLLRSAARNVAHGAKGVALYEIARVYEPTAERLPVEPMVLGCVMVGEREAASWTSPPKLWDLFQAKGVLDAVLDPLDAHPAYAPATGMPFHPTRAATIDIRGHSVGALGQLHPKVCNELDLPENTVVFEVGLAQVLSHLPQRVKVQTPPRFPAAYVDIALVVDEEVLAAEVAAVIAAAGAPELSESRLFDVYRGDQVPPGRKSLAYALELRSPERTLTDEDANAVRDRVVGELARRFAAELRA